MSGVKYLLDTNIILYLLSGDVFITQHLDQKVLYASIITEIELLSFQKLSLTEERHIKLFLSETRVIYPDATIKEQAIKLRRSYGLKVPDALIAATLFSLDLTLISVDVQFKKVFELQLELYAP